MRSDRLISLGLVGPCRRLFAQQSSRVWQRGRPLPLLMYHGITNDMEAGIAPYYRTNTSPAAFRRHIQFLSENGYSTLSLKEAVAYLQNAQGRKDNEEQNSSKKSLVITFDDGFRDFYTQAFPILQEFGLSATMFPPTALINRNKSSVKRIRAFAGKEFLTWSEIREMRCAGVEIGSHTVNHPRLVELEWPEIESEIRDSKSEIENELGETISSFAYPFAFPQNNEQFVNAFKNCLKNAGYDCCVTTEIGRAKIGDDPYRLKRLPMNSCDDERLFRAKLEGDYDWLALPQSGLKALKKWRFPRNKAKKVSLEARAAVGG